MSTADLSAGALKKRSFIFKLLALCMIAYFVSVIGLMLIGQLFWGFSYSHQQAPLNIIMLPFVIALLAGLLLLAYYCIKKESGIELTERSPYKKLVLFQICLYAFQCALVYTTRFHAVCECVSTYEGAYALATGAPVTNADFFRIYPHNAPNALLTSYVVRLSLLLGIAEPPAFFPYVGAFLLNMTVGLMSAVVYRLTKHASIMWITAWIAAVWIGTSQFMMIPYSDIYSVLFPTLALWVYTGKQRGFFRWFWFSLVCFIGFAVRPTVLILWLAAVLYSACIAIFGKPRLKSLIKKSAIACLAMLLAFLPASQWKAAAVTALAGTRDPQEALTVTHYLMMGVNYSTLGEFSMADYNYSLSFDTVRERQEANLITVMDRISRMTSRERLKLALIKLYKPHADGNFFSDCAYIKYAPPRDDFISPMLRSVYHKTGENHIYYISLQQIIWLAVLALCTASALTLRAQPRELFLLGLAVMGMALYNLLGENWTRYLFVFAPLFLIMAMLGLNGFAAAICEAKAKRRGKGVIPF